MKTYFNNSEATDPGTSALPSPNTTNVLLRRLIRFDGMDRPSKLPWAFTQVVLAQAEDADFRSMVSGMREWLVLIGAFLALFIVAVIVIVIYSARRHRHRHHHHHHHSHQSTPPSAEPVLRERKRHRRHRHHHHHENLPMNPTLAETGGLPPVRPEDQPPKF